MYTKQILNPGYVGSKGVPSFIGLYRKQWIGFEGAPESQLLTFNSPLRDKRNGVGVALMHSEIGAFNNWEGILSYSYDLINEADMSLRIGIMGSARQLNLNLTREDQVIRNIGDPTVTDVNDRFPIINGNVGAGIYLNVKGIYAGFSVPNILANRLGREVSTTTVAQDQPHFYGMVGAMIPVPDSKVSIYPNALFKYVENAPFSLDLNFSIVYNNLLTLGASYRHGQTNSDSIDFLAHFQATPQFGIGLAYDLPISDIKDYNSGSIEVMLSYNIVRKNPDMSNPRFFF